MSFRTGQWVDLYEIRKVVAGGSHWVLQIKKTGIVRGVHTNYLLSSLAAVLCRLRKELTDFIHQNTSRIRNLSAPL